MGAQFPYWLEVLADISLVLAGVCALVIIADLFRHPQHMWIMDVVWPVTALYFGPVAVWAYFKWGRAPSHHQHHSGHEGKKPFWQMCALAATHCGSGCTLGDLVAESTLSGHKIFVTWSADFALAFLFGIAFQYFTIKPMRNLSVKQGLIAAVKADTLSLTSWQVGMYGWMAVVLFVIFGHKIGHGPVFWFMMQIAMGFGFATAYPVNWALLKKGIKEPM